jgi:hypothetical protein
VLLGQIFIVSGLLVWQNGSLMARWAIAWATGLWLFLIYAAGILSTIDIALDEAVSTFLGQLAANLPIFSLGVQLPHWAARIYFDWRLELVTNQDAKTRTIPLSIRDILFGTAVVAVTIAAAQFSWDKELHTDPGRILEVAIPVAALVGLSLFLLPLIVFVLRGSAAHAIAYILFVPLGGLFLYMAIMVSLAAGRGIPLEDLLLMYFSGVICLAYSSLALWLARLAGYRLVMGKAARRSADVEGA